MISKNPNLSKRLIVGLMSFALILALPVGAEDGFAYSQAFTERAEDFFDKAAATEQQDLLHRWLTSNQVKSNAAVIEVPFSSKELAVLEGPRTELREQVGLSKVVDVNIAFAGVAPGAKAQTWAHGAVQKKGEALVWTSSVSSPGASAIRLHFSKFSLPAGSELYLYNDFGKAFGPYTGKGVFDNGDFWANTVAGDKVMIQLHHKGDPATLAKASFVIEEVGHLGSKFLFGRLQNPANTKAFCSFNEGCIQNAACSSVPGAISAAEDAVGHMLYASGASLFICSGGLLADTVSGSQIPYFLTANHCISKNNEANSLETFFQFTTNCNGSCYNPDGVVPSVLGSSIKAKSRTSDYTLLELSGPAPSGSAFLGWSTAPVAFANNTNLFRISHPKGAPQAYSEHRVDTATGTCSTWPRGNWIYSEDTTGATEGGSSGSPVLNSSGQVVGQLSGACGFNPSVACDASNATVDGAFAAYFSSVEQFLDPGTGSCTDGDGDGFCAADDCDDSDPNINPGQSEICGDGVDNDCDGAVDEGCGICLNKGDICTSNSQCCSNKCKGGGTKTCK